MEAETVMHCGSCGKHITPNVCSGTDVEEVSGRILQNFIYTLILH